MATVRLTDRLLEKATPPDGAAQLIIRDAEVAGFACVVGQRRRTFVVELRIDGQRKMTTIGRLGEVRPDGYPWTATLARQKARELTGQAADGIDPTAPRATGPTLLEGLELHVSNLRKRRGAKAARSIETIDSEVRRYLGPEPKTRAAERDDPKARARRKAAGLPPLVEWVNWLERPLADLTTAVLRGVHDRILAEAKGRGGGNPDNAPGASVANRVRRHVSAIWETLDRDRELPFRNPARGVQPSEVVERESRIATEDFKAWYAAVMKIKNPIRRDLQLLTLFTGVRRGGVTALEWSHVDFEHGLLQIRKAKGAKPYTLPLGAAAREILERRRDGNVIEFEPFGGDHGFVFPSLTRAKVAGPRGRRTFAVQPVVEVKESIMVTDPVTKEPRKIRDPALPPVHDLRRTFNSIATEAGVPKEAREMLMNHAGQGVNCKHYTKPQNWDYLASCLAATERVLWARIKAKPVKALPAAVPLLGAGKRRQRKRRGG